MPTFTAQQPALFKPIKVGRMTLQHRVVLAPMSRLRAHASGVPGPHQATYYAQRGSTPGTLLISEGTFVSHDAGGYTHVPGIYTDAHIRGWKKVTDAVHAKGSYIYLQLWALGRSAETDCLANQSPPSPHVSASAIALTGSATPRAMTEVEIKRYIVDYAKAASNAVHHAGFDGVEVHAANGYLLDQFLQTTSNVRADKWGGDEHGRTRFVRAVVGAIADAVGEDRVGIRVSPWSDFQGMKMPDPRPTFAYLVRALRDTHPRMAYMHAVEPRVSGVADVAPGADESNGFLREIWQGGERVFISAGGHTRETAMRTAEDEGVLVAFGRLYISNPDLPTRLARNVGLAPWDRSTYAMRGNLTPCGYTDWPIAAPQSSHMS